MDRFTEHDRFTAWVNSHVPVEAYSIDMRKFWSGIFNNYKARILTELVDVCRDVMSTH